MIEQERCGGEDILQELFGTSGSLSLSKGLYDDNYLDNVLCRHDKALPITRTYMSGTNGCLMRSHSVEDMPISDNDIAILTRPEPGTRAQSVFPSLSSSMSPPPCESIPMDVRRFSQELPMYLLKEDEGNDEEIRQIMEASANSSQWRTDRQQQQCNVSDECNGLSSGSGVGVATSVAGAVSHPGSPVTSEWPGSGGHVTPSFTPILSPSPVPSLPSHPTSPSPSSTLYALLSPSSYFSPAPSSATTTPTPDVDTPMSNTSVSSSPPSLIHHASQLACSQNLSVADARTENREQCESSDPPSPPPPPPPPPPLLPTPPAPTTLPLRQANSSLVDLSSVTHLCNGSLLTSPSPSPSHSPSPVSVDQNGASGIGKALHTTSRFPLVNWTRMTAIPINILPVENSERDRAAIPVQQRTFPPKSTLNRRRRKHGGGWPKGKKRKPEHEQKPPKPPVTSYGAFQREQCDRLKSTAGPINMSDTSKHLAQMWAALSSEEKESYQVKATEDRQRYSNELCNYVINTNTGLALQEPSIRSTIQWAFDGVDNDASLQCQLCSMNFSSVKTKMAHFCGKPHSQELLMKLQDYVVAQSQLANCGGSSTRLANDDSQTRLNSQLSQAKRKKTGDRIMEETTAERNQDNCNFETSSCHMIQNSRLSSNHGAGMESPHMDDSLAATEHTHTSVDCSGESEQIDDLCRNPSSSCVEELPTGTACGSDEDDDDDPTSPSTSPALSPAYLSASEHLTPEDWQLVCSSMDGYLTNIRTMSSELTSQQSKQSQLLEHCCSMAEQLTEAEHNIALWRDDLSQLKVEEQGLQCSLRTITDFFSRIQD